MVGVGRDGVGGGGGVGGEGRDLTEARQQVARERHLSILYYIIYIYI